jgi:hypothetical protein
MRPIEGDPLFEAFQRDWEGGPDCDLIPDPPEPYPLLERVVQTVGVAGFVGAVAVGAWLR